MGVGHIGCRLHYAIIILGVGDSKILTCREMIVKGEGEGGRERQPMHGEIVIQEQRAKAAVTWAMVGSVQSGFIEKWLVAKNEGDNNVVISLWLVTSCVVPYFKPSIQQTFKSDRTSSLSPRCAVFTSRQSIMLLVFQFEWFVNVM